MAPSLIADLNQKLDELDVDNDADPAEIEMVMEALADEMVKMLITDVDHQFVTAGRYRAPNHIAIDLDLTASTMAAESAGDEMSNRAANFFNSRLSQWGVTQKNVVVERYEVISDSQALAHLRMNF